MARTTHKIVLYTHLISWEPLRVKASRGLRLDQDPRQG